MSQWVVKIYTDEERASAAWDRWMSPMSVDAALEVCEFEDLTPAEWVRQRKEERDAIGLNPPAYGYDEWERLLVFAMTSA